MRKLLIIAALIFAFPQAAVSEPVILKASPSKTNVALNVVRGFAALQQQTAEDGGKVDLVLSASNSEQAQQVAARAARRDPCNLVVHPASKPQVVWAVITPSGQHADTTAALAQSSMTIGALLPNHVIVPDTATALAGLE